MIASSLPLLLATLATARGPAATVHDGPGAGGNSAQASSSVRWERRLDDARRKAKATHKPIMIDFWAEWCGWCRRLDTTTYVDPAVVKLLEQFVPVKVNTEGGRHDEAVALQYDVTSLPTIAFVSPEGRLITRLNGFQGPGQFPRTLEAAKKLADRVMALEDALERNPDDAGALAALGVHLYEQDAYRESKQVLDRAVRVDAARPVPERKRNRLLLAALEKTERRYPEAETLIREGLALEANAEYDPKLLYVLGKVYASWGRPDQARAALNKVLEQYAQSAIAAKARETLAGLDADPRNTTNNNNNKK